MKAVFPESSLSPKLAETIASETGAPLDHTLYGDTLGPGGLERRHLPADGGGERRRDGAGLHRRASGARSGDRMSRMTARAPVGRGQGASQRGYGGAAPAIEDVTFRVRPGERVALLGPNGGGKTTLLRVLLGELGPIARVAAGAAPLRRRPADGALAARLPGLRARRRR